MKRKLYIPLAGFMLMSLVLLSCGAVQGLFATPTFTATLTFTPIVTPSATPTLTPTSTSTPVPTGVKGVEQSDGTTLFTDYDNRYQLLLPPGREVVFSSQKELQQAVAGSNAPELAEMAENFKDADPDVFRLAAMNTERKYLEASAPTLLTINTVEDPMASAMPMAFVTAMIEDNILEGATSTTWDVINNKNGVRLASLKEQEHLMVSMG